MGISRFSFKKKIVFFVFAVVFGITVGFFLSEVALRVAGPAWLRQLMVGTNLDGQIRYGSDAGWPVDSKNGKFVRFKPEKEFAVKYYEYSTTVHTDQWGGRLVPSVKQTSGSPLVPVLGDSFAFGLGVKDEETFVNLLCENSDAVYLNLGAPGSSLPNQLDIVEFRHKELGSPGLYIFVFFLGNDFTDMMKYYEDLATVTKNPESGITDIVNQSSLIQRSYVAQFISHFVSEDSDSRTKRKSRYYRTPGGERISSSIYLLMSRSRGYSLEVQKVLDRSLDRLDTLSKRLRFRPEFIVIPDKHQTDPELFKKQAAVLNLPPEQLDRSFPDRILEENLAKRGIPYLDVMMCLKDRAGLYYKMDDHLTAEGHRVVADCIHQNSVGAGLRLARGENK